jgi:PKD repeat protein
MKILGKGMMIGSLALSGLTTQELIAEPASAENTRYVSTAGNDGWDGLSEETAFETIGKAIADLELSLPDGAVGDVLVAAGKYPVSAQLALTNKAIRVIGSTGDPRDVVVYRSQNDIRLFLIDNADAGVSSLTVSNGNLRSTYGSGGNIHLGAAGGTVDRCIVTHGSCIGYGGTGGNIHMLTGAVTRCIISNGRCHDREAHASNIELDGGLLESSLVRRGSSAGAVGAVSVNGTALVRNCTICENSATRGGGVSFESNTPRVVNTVIYGNTATAPIGADSDVYGFDVKYLGRFENCLTDSVTPLNETCFNDRFGFANLSNGDYRLKATSSGYNAGVACTFSAETDLNGNVRTFGSIPDIGCYENVSADFSASFAAANTEAIGSVEAVFAAITANGVGALSYEWNFGDESPIVSTTNPQVTHRYEGVGYYTVTLTVYDGASGIAVETQPRVVRVLADTLYVKEGNATPVEPYATVETAAATLGDAVAVALDGCAIVVFPGTYQLAGTVRLEDAVRIVGQTGKPADVTIKGKGRAFFLNHPEAAVSSVTIRDGRADAASGGGVYIDSLGGMVSNCLITACSADNYWANAGGAYLVTGLLTHCEIFDCKLTRGNGGFSDRGIAVSLEAKATMENCLIRDFARANFQCNTGIFAIAHEGCLGGLQPGV